MFNYPELSLKKVDYDAYWRSKRGQSMGALSDWQIERADIIVRTLKGAAVRSICDIAAGEGGILKYVSDRVGATDLVGTDISDVALERIREFGIKAVKLDIGDPAKLSDIPAADYQLMLEILEHVPHSELLLQAAYEKAEKGVFFSFPNTGFFAHRFRLLLGKFPLQWRLFPGEHVRFWTKSDLHWWLTSLGYRHFKVHYYKGMPILNKLWPSLFAAAFVVYLPKN